MNHNHLKTCIIQRISDDFTNGGGDPLSMTVLQGETEESFLLAPDVGVGQGQHLIPDEFHPWVGPNEFLDWFIPAI